MRQLLTIILIVFLTAIPAAQSAARELPDFTRLVEKSSGGVVNISTTQRIKRPAAPTPEFGQPDTPSYDYPGKFGQGEPEQLESTSLGSGFFISSDGYILTCAHVVEGASEIMVKLTDKREYAARLVGSDRRSDIAVLKIDASKLPRVLTGEPERVRVGDWVLAIGSPFGFDSSATSGIVSAKGRSLPTENYIPFIQTDVAINPGNSGGPLFNLRGEVIGMNSQIYSRTGVYMGLSFAIPIDIAMQIAQQLKTDGRVRRGWLGVSLQEVNRGLATAYGMEQPRGALVSDILPAGPASRSDLRSGDVVLEYERRPIVASSDLPPLVGLTPPGTRARVKIFRRGQGVQMATVVVGELKEEPVKKVAAPPHRRDGGRLGLALSEARRQDSSHGVSVDGVDEGPARSAGLRPGDVITEIDGKPVNGINGFDRLIAHANPSRPVVLRVRRGAMSLYLALHVGS